MEVIKHKLQPIAKVIKVEIVYSGKDTKIGI